MNTYETSSGNIFADLELLDAENLLKEAENRRTKQGYSCSFCQNFDMCVREQGKDKLAQIDSSNCFTFVPLEIVIVNEDEMEFRTGGAWQRGE